VIQRLKILQDSEYNHYEHTYIKVHAASARRQCENPAANERFIIRALTFPVGRRFNLRFPTFGGNERIPAGRSTKSLNSRVPAITGLISIQINLYKSIESFEVFSWIFFVLRTMVRNHTILFFLLVNMGILLDHSSGSLLISRGPHQQGLLLRLRGGISREEMEKRAKSHNAPSLSSKKEEEQAFIVNIDTVRFTLCGEEHEMPIVDVDIPLVQGESLVAIHLAAAEGNLVVFEGLLRVGAKVDQSNSDGDTAAHLAAFNGNLHILEVKMTFP
jgi:hypothetical protein